MKYVLLAALSLASLGANAYLGYPPREEMNQVTIQKVKEIVRQKHLVPGRFAVTTVKMNNVYQIDSSNGCSYKARVQWGEFGWPYVDGVRVKLIGCR